LLGTCLCVKQLVNSRVFKKELGSVSGYG